MDRGWQIGGLEKPACVRLLDYTVTRSQPGSNIVMGRVVSIRYGLTRTMVQVKGEGQVMIRIRRVRGGAAWPPVRIDELVQVRNPEEAVLLGTEGVWPGKPRWNRWLGRIVQVGPESGGSLVTVKLKGEPITLRSASPVAGLHRRPQTWDSVTVAVDPERVELCRVQEAAGERSRIQIGRALCDPDHHRDGWVWLKGVVQSIRRGADACILELKIGDAHVAVHVDRELVSDRRWEPGRSMQLHLTRWEAWIKPAGSGTEPIPCLVTY